MKLMNGWLNKGRQKGLFGEEKECRHADGMKKHNSTFSNAEKTQ